MTEIERKLKITILMPLLCHFCNEPITKLNGRGSESLLIHSLDGNHDNWDPRNKVPTHKGCHASYHPSHKNPRKLYRRSDGTFHISLPKHWAKKVEETVGKKMIAVNMEINDKLIITPVFEKEEEE